MKIGIMSMQRIINYGSFMQALSLKNMLERLGHTVVFVDYISKPSVTSKKNVKLLLHLFLRRNRQRLNNLAVVKKISSMRGATTGLQAKFVDCYPLLGMSEKYCFHTKVDLLVIGSDEVFNCLQAGETVGFSMELFGKNSRAKRVISYAASFGSTTLARLEEYKVVDIIKSNLQNFAKISVRDNNSFSIVNALTGQTPPIHLDPVLVGEVENIEWSPIKTDEKYVAVYGYKGRFSAPEEEKIQKFAHNLGMKTLSIMDEQAFCDEVVEPKPDEILSYVKNAEYVITDTFHGVIFSVIYHKPFAVFCRKKSHTGSTNEEKLLDLLRRLNLMDRVIETDTDLERLFAKDINYSAIDVIRRQEREKAYDYLSEQCKI